MNHRHLLLTAAAAVAAPSIALAQVGDANHDRDADRAAHVSAPPARTQDAPSPARPTTPAAAPTPQAYGHGYDARGQRPPAPATQGRPAGGYAYGQPGHPYPAQTYGGADRPAYGYAAPGHAAPNQTYGAAGRPAGGYAYGQPGHPYPAQTYGAAGHMAYGYAGQNQAYAAHPGWNDHGRAYVAGQGWNNGGGNGGQWREGWWRGHPGFEGYYGRRNGYWYAPNVGYYRVDPYWAAYNWTVGAFVPAALRGYYVQEPYAYGLAPAPYGYQWIFLGDQLVLIDYAGRIVQIAAFY